MFYNLWSNSVGNGYPIRSAVGPFSLIVLNAVFI